MKRGRPQLKEGDKDFRKRNVTVAQMDFQKLEECYQQLAGDPSKTIWDATDKLSSKAVSEILELFIVMAEEKNTALKKKAKSAAPTAGELAADPHFQHAYTRCGVNSMDQLRKSHVYLTEVLPSRQTVWRARSEVITKDILPMMEVHDLGFELHPQKMMALAVDIFGLWDERMVAFRFSFDGAAVGASVFGFSLLHPSIPSDSSYAFFPAAVWDGPENGFFLRQQAPKVVEMLENYALEFRRNRGFAVLDARHRNLRVQMFLNPDMKGMTGATEIDGCLVCPFTWQGVRRADEPEISTYEVFREVYGAAPDQAELLADGHSLYKYLSGPATAKIPVFVVHPTLKKDMPDREGEMERMIAPAWLVVRDFETLLSSQKGRFLAVRVFMLVPDFMLHGIKRLVEKMIRDSLAFLMDFDERHLKHKEKLERVADFTRGVQRVLVQFTDLSMDTWLDDKCKKAGRVKLSSKDACALLSELPDLLPILAPREEHLVALKGVASALGDFFKVLKRGPASADGEEHLDALDKAVQRAIRVRHKFFGAENDAVYEHMMHFVPDFERFLIQRGLSFLLFSMQAPEAYNQRIAADIRSRTVKHPNLTLGRVPDEKKEMKAAVDKAVADAMKTWDTKRAGRKVELEKLTMDGLKRLSQELGVIGYSSLPKQALVESVLRKEQLLAKQRSLVRALKQNDLFEYGVRNWSLLQAAFNEHFLKEFVRIERDKGREESDVNVWSKKEVEEQRTRMWSNAYTIIDEANDARTPTSASGASGGPRKQQNSPEERCSPPPTPVQARKRSKKSK